MTCGLRKNGRQTDTEIVAHSTFRMPLHPPSRLFGESRIDFVDLNLEVEILGAYRTVGAFLVDEVDLKNSGLEKRLKRI